MKEFIVQTLIDITETGQRRKLPGLEIEYQQQQNFTMLLQTIGMRVNLHYTSGPKSKDDDVANYQFGSNFKGKHRIWTFKFGIEYDGGFTDASGNSSGLLVDDLHFIPMILGLDETVDMPMALFDTKSLDNKNTLVFASD